MNFTTVLYDLKFSSEFPLANMPCKQSNERADVHVKKGRLRRPKDGKKGFYYKPFSVISKDSFFLEVPNIARFKITKDLIIIHKLRGATNQDVFAFFFDTVLVVILLMNERFVLHASAISINKKAYLFCANEGAGKSLLAASFMKNKNVKIIEDDKCLIQFDKRTKRFVIKNWYPFMELWSSDLKYIQDKKKIKPIKRLRKNIQKIQLDIGSVVPKYNTPIEKLILVQIGNDETKVAQEEIKGFKKSRVLLNHIQFEKFISFFQKSKQQFNFISSLASQVSIAHVQRSNLTKADDFIKFIDEELLQKTT